MVNILIKVTFRIIWYLKIILKKLGYPNKRAAKEVAQLIRKYLEEDESKVS